MARRARRRFETRGRIVTTYGRAGAAERARLPGLFLVPIGAGRETEVGEEPGPSLRDLLLGRAMGRARARVLCHGTRATLSSREEPGERRLIRSYPSLRDPVGEDGANERAGVVCEVRSTCRAPPPTRGCAGAWATCSAAPR